MSVSRDDAPFQRWHSNDFLVRIRRGEQPDDELKPLPDPTPAVADSFNPEAASPFSLRFNEPSLVSISGDPELHQRLHLIRKGKFLNRHLINFGARNKSLWALEVLVSRLTGGRHDWAFLRSIAVGLGGAPNSLESELDRIKLEDLFGLCQLLHERRLDEEAERGLLRFIAAGVLAGRKFDEELDEALLESLLAAGLPDQARSLFHRLTADNWLRHVIAVDLLHPRFGGSYDAMLVALNQPYRRFGLEQITLDGTGNTMFERLTASAQGSARPGPLVTVVMSCWRPGPATFTAVRSIIQQTYQDWELLITDDASPSEYAPVLQELEDLDPRIRVIRNAANAGTYVRRNEAIAQARGEFVTMQDSDDWAHPRRLEIQVRDMLAMRGRLANVVKGARVTEEFSLVSPRGARLYLVEPSLMFRREAVVDAIGYFDTTRKGADTEFRQRLELATRAAVPAVGPELPLVFQLADAGSLSGSDFGNGIWTDPARVAYRSSIRRFHSRIRSGEVSPRIPFPQDERLINAPPKLLGTEPEPREFDLIVVLDAHRIPARAAFLDAVLDEIQTAVSMGLKVAILHSDSPNGARNAGPISEPLQALVDNGQLIRLLPDDEARAATVVVRHAVAAQGHPSWRRPVHATRVVIVEDKAGGDVGGETFSRADARETVTHWFGVEPTWIAARQTPARPTLNSVVVEGDTVSVRLKSATGFASISGVRISNGTTFAQLTLGPVEVIDDGYALTASGEVSGLPTGDLSVIVERPVDGEPPALQTCFFSAQSRTVLTGPGERILIGTADGGGLRLLPSASEQDINGAGDFFGSYLAAEVSHMRVLRDQFEVTVTGPNVGQLTSLCALRNVNGKIKRRNFTIELANHREVRARHRLPALVDVRWRIYGMFQTPLGAVEVPLEITDQTRTISDDDYRVRKLPDKGVVHVVPRPTDAQPAKVPELSVVMPVYNVEPYLDTAIRSVLTQDFEDLELIIVDDASTDNGRRVIEMHRDLDPRVRVIELDHNTLGGAGVPSNIGIRAARGKYIAFVDSDDWVSKTGLDQLLRLAKTHDAELVIGDFRVFREGDRRIELPYDSAAWLDLPPGQVMSAATHPALLRLSPVPWRKLYRRDFLQAHGVQFPEGDFFLEDNPLHWFALSRATRVVVSTEVVAYHRMDREGQTMSADAYKLGAVANHANTILNALLDHRMDSPDVFVEYFDYLRRQKWAVEHQSKQSASEALLKRALANVYNKAVAAMPEVQVPPRVADLFASYDTAYPVLDLTVIIPVYNCEDLLRETLDSVLKLRGIRYDVLLVDDGSSDSSLKIMREYEEAHSNVHVFTQKNRGAGRARNAVIPLATGRYTYFLDADDLVDAEVLARAVAYADAVAADLLFLKYRLDYVDKNRSTRMFDGDVEIWRKLPEATTNEERQQLVAGLKNFPWNRIIRTSVLHDANIFFGPTVVNNDVPFHWHSIIAATNIAFLDAVVCDHRKFARREQVTNISDQRRLAIVDALLGTHQTISRTSSYANVQAEWQTFALDLLDWAKQRIPAKLQDRFEERGSKFVELLFEPVDDERIDDPPADAGASNEGTSTEHPSALATSAALT